MADDVLVPTEVNMPPAGTDARAYRCLWVAGEVPRKPRGKPKPEPAWDNLVDDIHTCTRDGAEEFVGQMQVMGSDFGRTPTMAVRELPLEACPVTCTENCPCQLGDESPWDTMGRGSADERRRMEALFKNE